MKTLIIAAHPNLEESVINRRWLTELRKQPDLCTIHTLAACAIPMVGSMWSASIGSLRNTAA